MSYQDEHDRAPGRCQRLRGVSQRPSEVNDTRPGNKSSAYCKSLGEAKCDLCRTMNYVDLMKDGVCKHCIDSIQKGF